MSTVNLDSRDIISICVDDVSGGDISGRLYHCYGVGYDGFSCVIGLINVISSLLDGTGIPKSSVQYRDFLKKRSVAAERTELTMKTGPREVSAQKGKKGTFVVRIECRQNATWQGSVTWAERSVTQPFRSALELIKLIDGALEPAAAAGEEDASGKEIDD